MNDANNKNNQFAIRGLDSFPASVLFGMGIRKGENHKDTRVELKNIYLRLRKPLTGSWWTVGTLEK